MDTQEVWAELHAAEPDAIVSLKVPIQTTIGAHSQVEEVCAYGRYLGLTVEKETAGGWFNKVHYIKAEGTARDAIKWLQHVIDVLESR